MSIKTAFERLEVRGVSVHCLFESQGSHGDLSKWHGRVESRILRPVGAEIFNPSEPEVLYHLSPNCGASGYYERYSFCKNDNEGCGFAENTVSEVLKSYLADRFVGGRMIQSLLICFFKSNDDDSELDLFEFKFDSFARLRNDPPTERDAAVCALAREYMVDLRDSFFASGSSRKVITETLDWDVAPEDIDSLIDELPTRTWGIPESL